MNEKLLDRVALKLLTGSLIALDQPKTRYELLVDLGLPRQTACVLVMALGSLVRCGFVATCEGQYSLTARGRVAVRFSSMNHEDSVDHREGELPMPHAGQVIALATTLPRGWTLDTLCFERSFSFTSACSCGRTWGIQCSVGVGVDGAEGLTARVELVDTRRWKHMRRAFKALRASNTDALARLPKLATSNPRCACIRRITRKLKSLGYTGRFRKMNWLGSTFDEALFKKAIGSTGDATTEMAGLDSLFAERSSAPD